MGAELLVNFLVDTCCHNSLLEELSTSYVTPLGEDSWKFVPDFLQNSPHVSFPSAKFALLPFAVINHNHELESSDSYILSPVSLPSKSLNPRVVT